MKDKIKRFLIDKKELLMFIAVVLVVFATVITIATLALKETPVEQPTIGDEQTPPVIDPTDEPNEPVVTIKTFALPIAPLCLTLDYLVFKTILYCFENFVNS